MIEYTDNKEGGKKREYKKKYYHKKSNTKEGGVKNREEIKGKLEPTK